MSTLFGLYEFSSKRAIEEDLHTLALMTEAYATDGVDTFIGGEIAMGIQPWHSHRRSRLSSSISSDVHGNRVCLDGRLDNFKELCVDLELNADATSDAEIILASFRAHGGGCFSQFVGDWAIVIWSKRDATLYLARDHAGTRTLYFRNNGTTLTWSTDLETFFSSGFRYALNLEYVASFLTSELTHLMTPFEGISVVPPAHYVAIGSSGTLKTTRHWNWMVDDLLSYARETDYDDHFLELFRQAVARRTEVDDSPILAELSGGMDSSAIVCMSDHIRRKRGVKAEQLIDTVTYYDDGDPNWDELPFVASVEQQREKQGVHLPLPLLSVDAIPTAEAYMHPGGSRATYDNDRHFERVLGRHRVIVSGLGGDELLGGVPTGIPELADYLVAGRVGTFVRRSLAWSLPHRTPLLHTWRDTLDFVWNTRRSAQTSSKSSPVWGTDRLKSLTASLKRSSPPMPRAQRFIPSRVCNGMSWWGVLETLPHLRPRTRVRREYRYPYLDRDLDDFLMRVPREQLLAPGRRRTLMRRALSGIMPLEVIERRRKGFRSHALLPILSSERDAVLELCGDGLGRRLGFVRSDVKASICAALEGWNQSEIPSLTRLLLFEEWAASASTRGRLQTPLNRLVTERVTTSSAVTQQSV